MAVDLTQNPLYRRPYGQNNPLMPQQSWQLPPNEYFPRTNYAAQDVNNLLGNFFTQNSANYTPQYQPVTTEAYQTASARPSSEFDAQPLLSYAYQTTPPTTGYQPARDVPQPPAGSAQDRIKRSWQNDIVPGLLDYLQNQAIQNMMQNAFTGLTGTAAIGVGLRSMSPFILHKLYSNPTIGKPIADGLVRFGQTKVGNTLAKYADKIIDLIP